jgi:hypothetical protein
MPVVMLGLIMSVSVGVAVMAQTPQPFPRPGGTPSQQQPSVPAPAPAAPRPAPPVTATPSAPSPAPPAQAPAPAPAAGAATQAGVPTAAMLGFPIYPTAQFIASYDAGRGQRYYLFGATAPYADLVTFYRGQLKERGDQVFEQPPTHMFQIGRFRDETMAFPPGVTVKDWTWGGSQGYPNPKLGAEPARFPTIIMIVPAPPAAAPPAR